ncbi:MAG TPA: hypothetical protein VMR86_22205 [Myxococcota bacterium]|nr:hypothetical protein [Myxococcota bacterium]
MKATALVLVTLLCPLVTQAKPLSMPKPFAECRADFDAAIAKAKKDRRGYRITMDTKEVAELKVETEGHGTLTVTCIALTNTMLIDSTKPKEAWER